VGVGKSSATPVGLRPARPSISSGVSVALSSLLPSILPETCLGVPGTPATSANLLRTTASQSRDLSLPGLPAYQTPGGMVLQPSRGQAFLVSWLPWLVFLGFAGRVVAGDSV